MYSSFGGVFIKGMSLNKFYIWNIILPLVIGTIVYLYVKPSAPISQLIYFILHISPPVLRVGPTGIHRFIQCYLCDILWSYSLTFALSLYLGRDRLLLTYVIAASFSTLVEVLQLLPYILGSFDIFDIIVQLIACTISIRIITFYERRISDDKTGRDRDKDKE